MEGVYARGGARVRYEDEKSRRMRLDFECGRNWRLIWPRKEKRENGQNNAERCQGQTVKTNSVGIGVVFRFSSLAISLNIGGHIHVRDVRERVRHLEDGDE